MKPWIEYDFGQVVQIQKLIINARFRIGNPSRFSEVEARVGNVSASGDFSASTLLYYYPDYAADGEVLVLKGPNPLWGRFLSLQRMTPSDSHLGIANINIIGLL